MNKHSNNKTTTQPYFSLKSRAGFTLIELLIVIGIISVLAIAVTVAINPAELLKQARDSTRLTDIRAIDSSLALYTTDTGGQGDFGEANTVYISIPDTSQTCNNIANLPDLPSGWSYRCVTEDNLTNTDGTGWIPVDLTQLSFGTPISRLPIDPRNDAEQGLYYTYIAGSYIIEAPMESERRHLSTGYTFTISSIPTPTSLIKPGSVRARSCGDHATLTDLRDGNIYNLTVIGDGADQQCWFANNLDVQCSQGWCGYHPDDSGNLNGRLYTWDAAMDGSTEEGSQGLCPSGWRMASDQDFQVMEKFLGMSSQDAEDWWWRGSEEAGAMKEEGYGNPGWWDEVCGSNICNITKWSATGGGSRNTSGVFQDNLIQGWYWTSTPDSGSSSIIRYLLWDAVDIYRDTHDHANANSVRCIKEK